MNNSIDHRGLVVLICIDTHLYLHLYIYIDLRDTSLSKVLWLSSLSGPHYQFTMLYLSLIYLFIYF